MSEILSVAVAQPRCWAGDLERNAQAHATLIRGSGARLVVFPELSLTGYGLDVEPLALTDPALQEITRACSERDAIALAGAPVRSSSGQLHIAMLRVDAAGAQVAYRKGWLGEAECRRFAPGDGPTFTEVDGWRVGLGICKDTGVHEHVEGVAALGIDLYVAGVVHHRSELDEQDARAVQIARRCRAYVAFASFAGGTGEGYDVTAGHSAIWDREGRMSVRATDRAGEVVAASLIQG